MLVNLCLWAEVQVGELILTGSMPMWMVTGYGREIGRENTDWVGSVCQMCLAN